MSKKTRKKRKKKGGPRNVPRGTSSLAGQMGTAVLSLMAAQSESLMEDIYESQGIETKPKPKPRHNDPEVAKRIRAERLAQKAARAAALKEKS